MTQYKIISFVIAEVSRLKKGEAAEVHIAKSAPSYSGAAVPKQFVANEPDIDLDGHKASVTLKSYRPDIMIAELGFEVPDIFTDEVFALKAMAIEEGIKLLKKRGGKNVEEFYEEYTAYIVHGYEGSPEQFTSRHQDKIANRLKSEKLKLDPLEVDYTLSSSIKYEYNDLVIVDWDGAFIFSPQDDYEATVKLFELANLQLLRYRLLDRDLDKRFDWGTKLVKKSQEKKSGLFNFLKASDLKKGFQEIVTLHAQSVTEFEEVDRDIKLIGDWYSARLYELLSKKFKLDSWKGVIKEKLESLEDIYAIAGENLGISHTHILEMLQIWLFFVLQLGWFVLIILEFLYFTR